MKVLEGEGVPCGMRVGPCRDRTPLDGGSLLPITITITTRARTPLDGKEFITHFYNESLRKGPHNFRVGPCRDRIPLDGRKRVNTHYYNESLVKGPNNFRVLFHQGSNTPGWWERSLSPITIMNHSVKDTTTLDKPRKTPPAELIDNGWYHPQICFLLS